MVNRSTLTLTVRTVNTIVTIVGSAFVKCDAVVLQSVDKNFHSAGNFTLCVGIFHAQEQNTTRLVAHALGNGALHQVAQMDKAGGRGSHTGNNSAFRQLTGGKTGFHFLGSFRHLGKKELG